MRVKFDVLDRARRAQGITAAELMRRVGCDHANWWRIRERNATSLDTADRLCVELGLSLWEVEQ